MILHKDSIGFSVNFHVKLSILTVRKVGETILNKYNYFGGEEKTITRKIIT